MSSDPSRPDSPIPDLDLEVGDWSGSEKDLASRPVETVVTTRGAGDSVREVHTDTEHDVKDEAAENVNMGRIANRHYLCDSVRLWAQQRVDQEALSQPTRRGRHHRDASKTRCN